MNVYIKKIFRIIHRSFLLLYDDLSSSVVEASIGDVLLLRDVVECNQFLCASRVLDIQSFLKGDKTFVYQNAISSATYGVLHREKGGNKAFTSTRESFIINGYKPESGPMEVDSEIRLMNGTHRMGCCFQFGYPKVLLKVVKRRSKTLQNVDGYYSKMISSNILKRIYQQTLLIHQQLVNEGICFCAYVNSHDSQQRLSFIEDFKALAQVEKVLSRENETLILFTLKKPNYKTKNKKLVSLRVQKINEVLRKRYSQDIDFSISNNCLEGKKTYDFWITNSSS